MLFVCFVCYPKCGTCKNARKWLDDNGCEYTVRDIKADNPRAEEIETWRRISGLPLRKFFNTSGNAYKAHKKLGLAEKLPHMDEAEQVALLAADGMLVKRPLLVSGDFVLVGFKPEEWARRLFG